MIDYHVHTSLCNHATGTMEQYVQAAMARGIHSICFLDHLTFQEAGRDNAMQPRDVPVYVDSARRLARQYIERIDVRVGLEVDFSPDHVRQCVKMIHTLDLDVVAGSVHFLDGENVVSRRSAWSRGELDADDVYARYVEAMESMLDYDYVDMICHLDLPKKFNTRPSPSMVDRFGNLLKKIQARELVVELNTSGFTYPVAESFPSPDLIAQCARLGVPMVTGSDAHAPNQVGRAFDRARDLLGNAGYRHLTGFSHRQQETVPL